MAPLNHSKKTVIDIHDLSVNLGGADILQQLNLKVYEHEIIAVVGGSGSGKTTLLRSILMLNNAQGSIKVFDNELLSEDYYPPKWIRHQWGMMFQQGALFSSMTVLENIMYPMQSIAKFNHSTMEEIAKLKLAMVGLKPEAAFLYPSELSGGMIKRAAIARALALDPQLLFLDEPTAGLDPHGASGIDALILQLRETLQLTVVVITHDLDTLWRVTDRVAFLGNGKVLEVAPMKQLSQSSNPDIQSYFSDERARIARTLHESS